MGENDPDSKQDSYSYFCQMEPERRGEKGIDPKTGWRWEMRQIGMVRNAREDNMKWMKVFLDPAPHVILDQVVPLRGWYKCKHEPPGVRPRPCYTEAILTQPYGGACPVRCFFCYINNGVRGYRGQGITTIDPKYPEKVDKQIQKMRTASAVYISSFTEPFQPKLEPFYKNTQRLTNVIVRHGLPFFYLTRQVPPGWAYDALLRNQFSYLQHSINTPDPKAWKRLSPQAAPLDALFQSCRDASSRGIYVSIQVNPLLPGVVKPEEEEILVHRLAEAGCNHIIVKYVEVVQPAFPALLAQVQKRFSKERAQIFEDVVIENIGHIRTARESYRRERHSALADLCHKVGMTYSLCYEYGYERDASGQIVDTAGISLGPEYQISDQCHGRRVPVYTRPTTEVPFTPIAGCPPSGCLYCEEHYKGAENAPCGNKLLVAATALKPADLKQAAFVPKAQRNRNDWKDGGDRRGTSIGEINPNEEIDGTPESI